MTTQPNATGHATRETMRGAGLVFLAEALILPTGLLTLALLTRRLGTGDYGLFTLASAIVTWIEWTITALFGRAANKAVAQETDWEPAATATLQLRTATGIGAALLLAVAARPLADLLGEPRLVQHLGLYAIDIPFFCAAQAHRDILVGLGGYRRRALLSATRWLVRLALIAAAMTLGAGIDGAIVATILVSVAECIVARIFVRPRLFTRAGYSFRRLLGYAAPLFVLALAQRLSARLDLFVLKGLGASAAIAGEYGVAQNLAVFPGLLTLSFAPLLQSTLTRLRRDGRASEERQLAREGLRVVVVLLPFLAAASGAADAIVVFVSGAAFAGAGPPFAWLAFAALGGMATSVAAAILVAEDRLRAASVLGVLPLAAQTAGLFWAVPRFGAQGAAAATALAAAAGALAAFAVLARGGVRPPLASTVRGLLFAAPAYVAGASFVPRGALALVVLAAIALVLAAVFALTGELSSSRRE